MKHTYVPVMKDGVRVGSAYIDADRLLVSITDQEIKKALWDDNLLTNVSITLPGRGELTIKANEESEGNNNG